ncbi:dimethylhistidine N-methyltransferase [Candidatus Tenderia electrophaga]|jgi:dimethylhistidine N-methyltransferase|uniref:Dimethylhistidine N-methyltransferase n=1 Tax=Candidatus Tenderia electrophaga TaxID=1748243 RepID=A0A0S2TDT8_9GAMM|nr:dimethylhistidine N-methyltransferase [Candidatus Tenderia electrophaga]
MTEHVTFHDHSPKTLSLYEAVVQGLSRPHKMIPPKFFYDDRGSELFDAICAQPEYYLPAAEHRLLTRCADELADLVGGGRVVIEPGAGSLKKIRWLLDALQPSAYVPMDISHTYLQSAARQLAAAFPWLPIHAACVDFSHSMPLPRQVPEGPRLVFFPGSSLGNFHPPEARDFLALIRDTVGQDGMLLIGVDTKKPAAVLDAAYNDAAGLTAQFNLNLLHRIQRELKADCDPQGFRHHAFYNSAAGRVEMHLVSAQSQRLRINGHRFDFDAGESVHTECSYKYAPAEFIGLAADAGFVPVKHWLAQDDLFGVYLLACG